MPPGLGSVVGTRSSLLLLTGIAVPEVVSVRDKDVQVTAWMHDTRVRSHGQC